MSENIVMPKLGMTMKEGTVEEWHKEKGDPVQEGDAVVTISSEKLTNEVEAPADGELLAIKAEAESSVKVGEVLGVVGQSGESGEDGSGSSGSEEVEADKDTSAQKETSSHKKNTSDGNKPDTSGEKESSGHSNSQRIFISPLARNIAQEQHLPIEKIKGTGGNGRITKLDINRVLENGLDKTEESQKDLARSQVAATSVAEAPVGEGLDPMRKAIAQNMRESLAQTAQLTLHRKASADKLIAFQETLRDEAASAEVDVKLSLTVLIARATVLALQDDPQINTRYEDGERTAFDEVHLGIATSLDNGLVVPVIGHAEQKNMGALAREMKDITAKARNGELDEGAMSGSTFTITNMGASGVEYFTPILNLHESGILGVGTTQEELALGENGQVKQVQKIPFSLTFDHQILDGAAAAEFLKTLIKYIENPYLLVL